MTLIWGQFHKRYLSHWPLKSAWKITHLKFTLNLPGANELITSSSGRRGNYKSRQTHRHNGSETAMSDFVVNPLHELRAWVSDYPHKNGIYTQTSNIRHTKFQNLNVSHPFLQLSLPNPLKPCVKSQMKVTGEAPATSRAPKLNTEAHLCSFLSIHF